MPPAVRAALLESLNTSPETVIVTGVSTTRVIRFASSEGMGWVDYAQKIALMNLFLAHGKFTVTTDLLGVRNTPMTFANCFFDPSTGPVFGPHPVPTGQHWLFDLPIRMGMPGA